MCDVYHDTPLFDTYDDTPLCYIYDNTSLCDVYDNTPIPLKGDTSLHSKGWQCTLFSDHPLRWRHSIYTLVILYVREHFSRQYSTVHIEMTVYTKHTLFDDILVFSVGRFLVCSVTFRSFLFKVHYTLCDNTSVHFICSNCEVSNYNSLHEVYLHMIWLHSTTSNYPKLHILKLSCTILLCVILLCIRLNPTTLQSPLSRVRLRKTTLHNITLYKTPLGNTP